METYELQEYLTDEESTIRFWLIVLAFLLDAIYGSIGIIALSTPYIDYPVKLFMLLTLVIYIGVEILLVAVIFSFIRKAYRRKYGYSRKVKET